MKNIVIITDNVYFQAKEICSIFTNHQQVCYAQEQKPDGSSVSKYKMQTLIYIQYVPADQAGIHVPRNNAGVAQMNINVGNKAQGKKEVQSILKQVQKQRKDDAALMEAFEEHFGGDSK